MRSCRSSGRGSHDVDNPVPTVSVTLGAVTGAWPQWRFERGSVDEVAERLVKALHSDGEPFLDEARTLDRLEQLVQEHELDDRRLVRMPIIRALRGDREGALAAFDAVSRRAEADAVDRWHARTGAARERKRFVSGFPRWFDGAAAMSENGGG